MWKHALVLAVLFTVGCGHSSGPSVEDRACETIKDLTPGFLETTWNVRTLSDPNSSQSDRLQAMREQLDAKAGRITYKPYTCSGPTWERYLREYEKSPN
ncbi:hypothetical protein [Nocardia sp. NPDC004260]